MSIIDFTNITCKKNNSITNKALIENFDKHFAMYSLTTIKKLPNIEISSNGEIFYTIKCNKEECQNIINTLSNFQCSHFSDTLVPIFTIIDNGLKIEFNILESE